MELTILVMDANNYLNRYFGKLKSTMQLGVCSNFLPPAWTGIQDYWVGVVV